MKQRIYATLLIVASVFFIAGSLLEAQAYPTYTNKDYPYDGYLTICRQVEKEYPSIPKGFLEAIVLSPPSSVYQAGPMHINPEHYADRMMKLQVTDMEKPESNIRLAADRISELFERYNDCYLVLVNYFNATEEQDMYIVDVLRKYTEIASANRYMR